MDMQAISLEIVRIRGRLRDLEAERESLSDNPTAETDLGEEETRLKARLAELQDQSAGKPDVSREIASQQKGSKPEEYVSG